MNALKTFLVWLLVSSKDPSKLSLTVRAALLGAIPGIIWVMGTLCTAGQVCLEVGPEELQSLAGALADLIFFIFSAIASLGVVYGFLRKVWLTAFPPKP